MGTRRCLTAGIVFGGALFGAALLTVPTTSVAPHGPIFATVASSDRLPPSVVSNTVEGDIGLAINIYNSPQLNYVIDDVSSYIRPNDMFILVSGNNGTALTTSWLNASANSLRQKFPSNKIYAYTAGLSNVAAAAKGTTSAISGIIYGYEPGMHNEPEFSWSFPAVVKNMAAASSSTDSYGKLSATAPTGRPLLESDLQQYAWNYGQLSNSMGMTIVQTQTWAQKGTSTLSQALSLLQNEYSGTSESWMPQLTVDSTDTNGISAQAAYADTQMIEADKLQYVSIWWSDATSYFGTYLSLLRPMAATSPPPTTTSSAIPSANSTRIYGTTADATAAEGLFSDFAWTKGICPGKSGDRPVILATDGTYPDALSGSYLAGYLGTGTLLTPSRSLSQATRSALQDEGITDVYVLGGPLAISTTVVNAIEAMEATSCGGRDPATGTIHVTRIYGTTEYTTAADVAATPGAGFVGSLDLAAAYGGSGRYNTTAGSSFSAPSAAGSLITAILAVGEGFQDAESAATLSYADHLPLLLTTPTRLSTAAMRAITLIGIHQVILMGGPLAVSTAVVADLQDMGVSVLRVAGIDYTQTETELADLELASAVSDLGAGWASTGGVTLARGDFYADGLAGAAVAAHGGASGKGPEPMLLTENATTVGPYLTSFLKQAGIGGIDTDGTVVSSLTVLGGPLAVTTTTVQSTKNDLAE